MSDLRYYIVPEVASMIDAAAVDFARMSDRMTAEARWGILLTRAYEGYCRGSDHEIHAKRLAAVSLAYLEQRAQARHG